MDLPRSLPARLYLLAYDPKKDRLTARFQLGAVLRAAALADLYLDRRLADDGGRPRVASVTRPAPDPVLDAVLTQIAGARPRSWRHWVAKDERRIVRAVRDQLEAERWIRVDRRRILPDRVRLRERRPVERYAARVRAALRPASDPDPRDAAALVLAAAGELTPVITRRGRREHGRRLEELADPAWPVVRALKKALQQKRAAAAGG